MATISINSYDFEYVEKGSGIPVVFVHGSINDYRIWKEQVEPFARHYHVFAYSRRYHYPNTWNGDSSDYSISLHATDLAALIRVLTPGRVHLVGSSYGAYTSLITAINHPDLVMSLVLGEPPILPLLVTDPDNPLQLFSLLLREFSTAKHFLKFGIKHMKPAQKALRNDELEEGVRLFANGALGKEEYDKLPKEVKATMLDNATSLKAELLGPGFPPFPVDEAQRMFIPTLLVYGENSPKLFHSISDKLLKILPIVEKTIIPNASHLIHGANPAEYNRTILEFLSKHSPS